MLEMVMGKKAEILLNGTPVSNQKIKQSGFKFKYQNVSEAIGSLAS
jgi:NAD dependent epimerase/dehydratase family enzyme